MMTRGLGVQNFDESGKYVTDESSTFSVYQTDVGAVISIVNEDLATKALQPFLIYTCDQYISGSNAP